MLKILLVASSKTTMGFNLAAKLPNLGLSSIAANSDRNICEIKILDLVLVKNNPEEYLIKTLKEYNPDITGFSCMTFQYHEILNLMKAVKKFNKNIKTIIGGYGPTVNYDEILHNDDMEFIDFILRNEGEYAFNELIKAINESNNDFSKVPNISYLKDGKIISNPTSPLLDLDNIMPPDRDARIFKKGFHIFGEPADVIETTRGCKYDCKFCSITSMYGKTYRKFKTERVITDIKDAFNRGAKSILIVDDNITLDTKHFKEICYAIIENKLNKIKFVVQASIKGLKSNPEIIGLMKDAGISWVFLGLESSSEEALKYYNKNNQIKDENDSIEVVKGLNNKNISIIGSFVLGNPDDTKETLLETYRFSKRIKLHAALFCLLTPFPGTVIRKELSEMNLITNQNDYSKYNMYYANVRTKYLTDKELSETVHKMDYAFLLESGAIWRLIKKHPAFIISIIVKVLKESPAEFFKYISRWKTK